MTKRNYDLDQWTETCSECGQDFVGNANPKNVSENPYISLTKHFSESHPEKCIVCPRRSSVPNITALGDKDFWMVKPNGDRVCSFCGGMHPDDFIKFCERVLTDESCYLDHSDKQYKVYIHQPSVRNADDGAIKFYKFHVTADGEEYARQEAAYNAAREASVGRMEKAWQSMSPMPSDISG